MSRLICPPGAKKLKEADYKEWWTPEWREAIREGLLLARDVPGGQMSRDIRAQRTDKPKRPHRRIALGKAHTGGRIALPFQFRKAKKLKEADYKEWWTPEWREAIREGLLLARDVTGESLSAKPTRAAA